MSSDRLTLMTSLGVRMSLQVSVDYTFMLHWYFGDVLQ